MPSENLFSRPTGGLKLTGPAEGLVLGQSLKATQGCNQSTCKGSDHLTRKVAGQTSTMCSAADLSYPPFLGSLLRHRSVRTHSLLIDNSEFGKFRHLIKPTDVWFQNAGDMSPRVFSCAVCFPGSTTPGGGGGRMAGIHQTSHQFSPVFPN